MLAAPRAQALLTFAHRDNDGSDQVIVTGTYSIGYDTNVFAQRVKHGALTQAFSCGATYTRRAGLITVEAGVTMNAGTFAGLPGQNYTDPSFSLGFTKGTGRTTGGLNFTAAKSNTPDPVANDRAIAWNYSAALSLRYPLIDRYYFTNTATVGGTSYQNQAIFANQVSYSDSFFVNVKYDSKLDFDTAYHFSLEQTNTTTNTTHSFSLGGTGTLFSKLTGAINMGFSFDQSHAAHQKAQSFQGLYADANLAWRFSRTLTFAGDATKTFGISSTNVITNTTTVGLKTDVNVIKRVRSSAEVTYVGTDFISPNGLGRKDTLWKFSVDLGTPITTHINTNLDYTYMENYSNLSTGKFIREILTLSITATY